MNTKNQGRLIRNVAITAALVGLTATLAAQSAGRRTASPPSATADFAPVVETVIPGQGDANQRFVDLDTGKQFAAAEFFGPKDEPSPEETQKWWRTTGIDAVGDTSPQIRGLVGFEMVASAVPNEEWDRLRPSDLKYYLTGTAPGTPVTMSGKGKLPATFVVKTREGGQGLLQIVGFTNNPPGVKIRYKRVGSGSGR